MQQTVAATGNQARSPRPPMWAKFGAWTVLALVGIALTDAALYIVHERAADWVDHSRAVRTVARDARLTVSDRRSAIDAFIITHDSSLLASDPGARRLLATDLDSLVKLTADNPGQQQRARAVATAYADWDTAFASAPLASSRGAESLKRAGLALFAPLSEKFAEFIAAEDELYKARRDRDRALSALTLALTIVPIAALVFVMLAMRRRLQAQTDALTDQQLQLEEQAIELENQVEELELTNKELSEATAETAHARDRAQLALADRDRVDAFLSASLASAPAGFGFLTPDLRYVRVNAVFAGTRGIPPDEWIGKHARDMASTPAIAATAVANLQHTLASGEPILDAAVDVVAPAGKRQRYSVNYFPVRDAQGELLGAGIITLNITARTELEEQFRQSQKMDALGKLASGVAHDFRNLLTVIRSYCDLVILETPGTDPRRNELPEIRTAADRAALLARQLLAFGKPQPLLAVEFDVNEGVRAVEGMLKHIAPASIAVEMRPAARLGAVLIDPGHVEQVLMNLAINAIDAMPDGGRLTFETANTVLDEAYTRNHPGVVPGPYVMLSVSDTGMGMDEATLARMFEPFFTTKAPGKGTGLGLATVYGIVAQNGGHTWVHSEPGHGTTFNIYFPRHVAEIATTGEFSAPKHEPVRSESAETVLIVEDDLAVRGSLSRILIKFGYTVLQAEHGADGLHVARTHDGPIHLAISDLMMPEMSGSEFARRLHEIRPATHVLFMSGYTDDEARVRGLVTESQEFIQKPFAIEDITRKVHDVLQEATQ